MNGRCLALAAALCFAVFAMLAAPVGLAMVAIIFGAGAAQANVCDVGVLAPAGGPVRLPVVGPFAVTSEFGMRVHPVTGVRKLHAGIDLSEQPSGGKVVAMQAGVVTSTSTDPAGGNIVAIDHGGGLQSRYMHLSSWVVRPGTAVQAGTVIGVEGATGRVTGPHVHWEVRVAGVAVDPRVWAADHGLALPPLGGTGVAPAAASVGATTPAVDRSVSPSSASASLPAQVGSYRGDQVRNAGLIVKAGQAMTLDPWTITVGVMTAMGESSLVNLDRGDLVGPDSRGLFQQRGNGAWGSYTDRMDPTTAATNFFKALLRVPGYHDLAPTIAAHRTQANADPYHYEKYWPEAVQMVSVLTADPSLLESLTAAGGVVTCSQDSLAAALPVAPTGACPPVSGAAEIGLTGPSLKVLRCVRQAFPTVSALQGVVSSPSGGVDLMIDNYRSPEGRAQGWRVAQWLRANASSLEVTEIVYDLKVWSLARDNEGWREYTPPGALADDTLAARDHVHAGTGRVPTG